MDITRSLKVLNSELLYTLAWKELRMQLDVSWTTNDIEDIEDIEDSQQILEKWFEVNTTPLLTVTESPAAAVSYILPAILEVDLEISSCTTEIDNSAILHTFTTNVKGRWFEVDTIALLTALESPAVSYSAPDKAPGLLGYKKATKRLQKENAELKRRLNETTQIQNMVKEMNKKLEMLSETFEKRIEKERNRYQRKLKIIRKEKENWKEQYDQLKKKHELQSEHQKNREIYLETRCEDLKNKNHDLVEYIAQFPKILEAVKKNAQEVF